MVHKTFLLFFRKLRLSEPWNHKAPFLICVPYFFLFAADARFDFALLAVLYSLCTIIGIAGFGYFCNDLADRDADQKAGISNGTIGLSKWQIILIFTVFLTAALLPWVFYFPVDRVSVSLLIAQFFLFIIYAVPPLRLKERGLPGIITDALYAHANPAILAAYTFYLLTGEVYHLLLLFLATLFFWQFFLGLRNILQHQILDIDNDRKAGAYTYAIKTGEKTAFHIMKNYFVPLELIGFIAFTYVASLTIPLLLIAWPLYSLIAVLIIRLHWKEKLLIPLHDRLYFFMDDYYLRWMPVIFLVALCIHDLKMILLLILHLTLFKNGFTPFLKRYVHLFRAMILKAYKNY